jgi:YrbI family 3-deoxy-D-manno-octulosonate 8-phosphate phosphatase
MNAIFKLLILDVDGVLTDGGMYYADSGDEFKKFNAKDGLAIQRVIKRFGLAIGIISNGHLTNLIQRRAQLLGITRVYVGTGNKLEILKSWCNELQIELSEVAYIGDDVNDLECMLQVGYSACPADAVQKIKDVAHIQLTKNGGDACVREFLDTYFDI